MVTVLIVFIFVNSIFLPEHLEHFYDRQNTHFHLAQAFFWLKSADYFNINSYFQPLLHTWSLSLEMQFYLVMPFLVFCLKISKKNILIISFSIIFFSLALSILFIEESKVFTFYRLDYVNFRYNNLSD